MGNLFNLSKLRVDVTDVRFVYFFDINQNNLISSISSNSVSCLFEFEITFVQKCYLMISRLTWLAGVVYFPAQLIFIRSMNLINLRMETPSFFK